MASGQSKKSSNPDKTFGLWEIIAIGIGGMVGGGIFAVLGLAVHLAAGGTPIAFAIAGLIALVTCYAYTKLSIAFPSQGGTVAFLNHAFGSGAVTGSLNVLLWLSYVVMLSLYSYAFGSYAAALVGSPDNLYLKHAFISAVILGIAALNLFSVSAVGKAEFWIVLVKVIILAVFVVVGIFAVQWQNLAPQHFSPVFSLVAGGMVIFMAYEGFELIANTAGDVATPKKTLPIAYFAAVGFVVLLYVLVSIVTVGTLSVHDIVAAKDYALAEAARPFMGQAGFTLIAVAAVLSTASAINATLYGAARLSYIIAKDGELPKVLEHRIWNKPIEGLLITAALTLVVANVFDLSSISTMGSAGFLLIFAAVNAANVVLARYTSSLRWVSVLASGLCLLALAGLLWHTLRTQPAHLWVLAGMIAISAGIEFGYRRATGRRMRVRFHVQLNEPRSADSRNQSKRP